MDRKTALEGVEVEEVAEGEMGIGNPVLQVEGVMVGAEDEVKARTDDNLA